MPKCLSCGETNRFNKFGCTKDYCCGACRVRKGKPLEALATNKPGRPRRFPLVTNEAECIVIIEDLKQRGWITLHEASRPIILVRRGWWTVSVGFGGGRRVEAASQVIAYIENGKVHYASPCRKGEVLPDKCQRKRRVPCGKCRKCVSAAWLAKSGQHTSDLLTEVDVRSENE